MRMSLDVITLTQPKSPISEAYRTLRTNLQFSNVDGDLKTISITSSGPAEGKTTTLCNVAETFAQSGKRTLIIDADLRKPRVHKVFKLSNAVGLTNVLTGQKKFEDVLQITGSHLQVLTCGPIPPNPAELLESKAMKQLLEVLSQHFDVILIDTPPVGVVTDGAIMASMVDGTILTVASHKTQIDGAKRAKQLLEQVNARIIGVVMTMMPVSKKGYYGYQYYNYEEQAGTKKRRKRR